MRWRALALAAALGLGACADRPAPTAAPLPSGAYEPVSGQAGKDVIWVPTSQALVDRMLAMAKVTEKDFVMDLGSGDGRLVITAAQRGARALGIEYNPDMVALSKKNAERAGVAGRASFVRQDLFQADLSQATVITLFLLPSLNLKLRPKLLALRPGTRIVSNSFTMDTWQPDETESVRDTPGCSSFCTAHLWIVPAKVAGTYRTPHGEVVLTQRFQELSGNLIPPRGRALPLSGKVVGEEILFAAGGRAYTGRLNGGTLELK
jgi:SAM-dependent methyltransferase